MEKNQLSQAPCAGVAATRNRRVFLAPFFLLALFIAFSAISFQPQTSAQAAAFAPDCAAACAAAFNECDANGGTGCEAQFNRCLSDCGLVR